MPRKKKITDQPDEKLIADQKAVQEVQSVGAKKKQRQKNETAKAEIQPVQENITIESEKSKKKTNSNTNKKNPEKSKAHQIKVEKEIEITPLEIIQAEKPAEGLTRNQRRNRNYRRNKRNRESGNPNNQNVQNIAAENLRQSELPEKKLEFNSNKSDKNFPKKNQENNNYRKNILKNKTAEVKLKQVTETENRTELPAKQNTKEILENSVKQNFNTKQEKIETKQLPKKAIQLPKLEYSKIDNRFLIKATERINPYYADFFNKINNFIDNELFFPKNLKLMLAVSGGSDSVTLLDVFANLAERNYYSITIVHYNHKLRGENSDKDEQFVKSLAQRYGLPFYSSSGNVKEFAETNSISIEHAARTLRYRYFSQIAQNLKINHILTAHTSDDSNETFLFNLLRGSGLTGLSGIPVKRKLNKNIYLFRPFIEFRKTDLLEYAVKRKLRWNEDETNTLLFYTRNKIRHDLLPNLENNFSPAVRTILTRTAKLLKGADAFIKDHIDLLITKVVKDKSPDRFTIRIPMLNTLSDFMKGEVLQHALMSLLKLTPVSMNTVDRIISLSEMPTGSTADITKKVFVLRDRDNLIFSKRQPSTKFNMSIEKTGSYQIQNHSLTLSEVSKRKVNFSEDPSTEYLDYDLLPIGLTIRSWEPGDYFQPLGMNGTIKLSDFLTNMKIPLIDKEKINLLVCKNEVIWVIGLRISEKFKVTPSSARFLKAELKRIK